MTDGLEGRCSIQLSYGRTTARIGKREMVGVERFELPTSCSQSRRATRLRYTPNAFTYAPLQELRMIRSTPILVNPF